MFIWNHIFCPTRQLLASTLNFRDTRILNHRRRGLSSCIILLNANGAVIEFVQIGYQQVRWAFLEVFSRSLLIFDSFYVDCSAIIVLILSRDKQQQSITASLDISLPLPVLLLIMRNLYLREVRRRKFITVRIKIPVNHSKYTVHQQECKYINRIPFERFVTYQSKRHSQHINRAAELHEYADCVERHHEGAKNQW